MSGSIPDPISNGKFCFLRRQILVPEFKFPGIFTVAILSQRLLVRLEGIYPFRHGRYSIR